jgi:hypothetical protein
MKTRLLWKLLGINVLVIALTVLTVWMAIDYLAADYYKDLMKQYNISPAEIHEMFVTATHRSLIQATIYALDFGRAAEFRAHKESSPPAFRDDAGNPKNCHGRLYGQGSYFVAG